MNDEYLPYKYIIGQVILDVRLSSDQCGSYGLFDEQKNPSLRTVVNKLNTIHAQFRFFDMELIAGVPEYTVTHVGPSIHNFAFLSVTCLSE